MTALIVTQETLWLVLAAIAATVLLLLRRLRGLYRRVAPLGALVPSVPSVMRLPRTGFVTITGTDLTAGGVRDDGRRQLLLFVSGSCPVSKKMVPVTVNFCERENLDLIFMGDETVEEQRAAAQALRIDGSRFVSDTETGRLLGVDRVPFAVLLGRDGDVEARGLVNSREHLESLLTATETGYASIQSFLAAHPHALPS